jgi:effector-binding domain-containing protein
MLKYSLITIGIILLIVLIGFFFMINQKPDISKYENLKTPKVSNKRSQKMLVVKANGSPEAITKNAYKVLFTTYFKLKGVPKYPYPAPLARWVGNLNTPMENWEGHFAVPVPENITSVPDIKDNSGLKVELATWDYGDVAEILYVGPYDKEIPAIEKLKNFIIENGYEIAGPHEEEYLVGPSPYFPRNPKKFVTIIRYQVKKIN